MRTLAEEAESAIHRIGVLSYASSEDGFVPARKTFRPLPRPTELKVKHFLKNNRFSGFSQREQKATAKQARGSALIVNDVCGALAVRTDDGGFPETSKIESRRFSKGSGFQNLRFLEMFQ